MSAISTSRGLLPSALPTTPAISSWSIIRPARLYPIEKRRWILGEGTGADEPCPVHRYPKAGEWTVTLYVEGPDGSDRRIKVWEVVTK